MIVKTAVTFDKQGLQRFDYNSDGERDNGFSSYRTGDDSYKMTSQRYGLTSDNSSQIYTLRTIKNSIVTVDDPASVITINDRGNKKTYTKDTFAEGKEALLKMLDERGRAIDANRWEKEDARFAAGLNKKPEHTVNELKDMQTTTFLNNALGISDIDHHINTNNSYRKVNLEAIDVHDGEHLLNSTKVIVDFRRTLNDSVINGQRSWSQPIDPQIYGGILDAIKKTEGEKGKSPKTWEELDDYLLDRFRIARLEEEKDKKFHDDKFGSYVDNSLLKLIGHESSNKANINPGDDIKLVEMGSVQLHPVKAFINRISQKLLAIDVFEGRNK